MKYSRSVLIAAVFMSMSLGGAIAEESTTSARYITADEVPQTVINGIKRDYPGAVFIKYEEEIWGKTKLYEILCEVDGEEVDLVYAATGKRISYELQVPIDELPKKLKALIFARKMFEDKIKDQGGDQAADQGKSKDKDVVYELGFKDDRGKVLYTFKCSEDGKFLGMTSNMGEDDQARSNQDRISLDDLPLEVRKRIVAEKTIENKKVAYYNMGFKDERGRRLYWFKCSKEGKFLGKI